MPDAAAVRCQTPVAAAVAAVLADDDDAVVDVAAAAYLRILDVPIERWRRHLERRMSSCFVSAGELRRRPKWTV